MSKKAMKSYHCLQDTILKNIETVSVKLDKHSNILKISFIDTQLGHMLVISDDKGICLLEFTDRCRLERKISMLIFKLEAFIIPGITDIILSIKDELKAYFSGKLIKFKTPINLLGSQFQKLVWEELMCIPYGKTQTYAALGCAIEKPIAYRAIASANAANQIAIVIPCHRVINSNGHLGGYAGGVTRKQWLIDHEKKHVSQY
ncbi:MAG: methylated-DNA--[protein]-cysteine S-methyltransferase [Candidatus Lariskella arthropodorum]